MSLWTRLLAIWPKNRTGAVYSDNGQFTEEFRELLREMESDEMRELAIAHGGLASDYCLRPDEAFFQRLGNEWFTKKTYINIKTFHYYTAWWFSRDALPTITKN